MTMFQAFILGAIQGLTEFLPISSSGHLVIFQHLFGLTEPELIFNISVHVGTLAAVIIFFKREIGSIIASTADYLSYAVRRRTVHPAEPLNPDLRFVFLIIMGSVPTAVIGLLLKKKADVIFSSITIVGFMLLITGSLLLITRWAARKEPPGFSINDFSVKAAVIIGIAQGIAIMPGISRSGATIATGLFLGLNRETAAKYSFLLSIPAILGAELLSIRDMIGNAGTVNISAILVGAATAGLTGYGALKLLMFIVSRGSLYLFAPYCFLAGAAALLIG